MNKFNRIISLLLAVIMLLGSFSLTAFAEEDVLLSAPVYEYNTANGMTLDYYGGRIIETAEDKDNKIVYTYVKGADGKEVVIDTAQAKLDAMDLRLEKDGYRLYVDAYSGEVAVESIETGESLFTNPFNVSASKATNPIKAQLLSQLAVKYTDVNLGSENTFYSFTEASERNQIIVKNIKGGIRVEYTLGREQSKLLVPIVIEASDFENDILAPLAAALGEDSYDYNKFYNWYRKYDKAEYEHSPDVIKQNPLMEKMVYYKMDSNANEVDKIRLEQVIKTYIPDYTFEDLDEAHLKTEYQSEDSNPPLFKMALEYMLDEEGLTVRLPANGIRFNESLYRVTSIEILPFMGAASSVGAGYTFFPDGSGALFDFAKIQELGTTTAITGKLYGQDFAYHTITGTHQEILRYPVFGIVGSNVVFRAEEEEEEIEEGEGTTDENVGDDIEENVQDDVTEEIPDDTVVEEPEATPDEEVPAEDEIPAEDEEPVISDEELAEMTIPSGFLAIVEEGDAMVEISTYHETQAHEYNAIRMMVYPRPQDSYNLANAVSVGLNSEWTVVSSRKYTGSYKVKYIMLTSEEVAKERNLEEYYDCSYMGMALAYRDYLIKEGVLTKLTENDVKKDIPLYIETFGAVEGVEKILSIPVTVLSPLTSFNDIMKMYDDLALEGITNVNFKLTGYANGGMKSTVPYNLKWEKAVGGEKDFELLLDYAKDNGFGVFPDFDFVFINNEGSFDGVSLKKHAVKTIDNRYSSRREYSATKQTYISYFELAIAPNSFSRFYEKLTSNYLEYEPIGISVSTLGSYLNSDFDEDDPYNREDAKGFTIAAFEYLDENYESVMTSGGNAYSWKYVDHITDVALESSRYAQAAATVPFLGIVLHGYVQFAGTPINMEGNVQYALLKAIENGAGLNFLLSYQNEKLLKEDDYLNKYYSVKYKIWKNDVVEIYNELNAALADVQTSAIVGHTFIDGIRVPDADEILADAQAAQEAAIQREKELLLAANDAERKSLMEARITIQNGYKNIETLLANFEKYARNIVYNNAGEKYEDMVLPLVEEYLAEKAKGDILRAELAELEAALPEPEPEEEPAEDAEATEDETPVADDTTESEEPKPLTPEEQAVEDKRKEVAAQEAIEKKTSGAAYVCYYNSTYNTTAALKEFAKLEKLLADSKAAIELLESVDSDEGLVEMLSKKVDAIEAAYNSIKNRPAELINYVQNVLFPKVDGIIAEATPYEPPVTEEKEEAPKTEVEEDADKIDTRYKSDDNMIVFVEYENGKSFLLNFNNYTVNVTLNETVYSLPAYGYVVFDSQK